MKTRPRHHGRPWGGNGGSVAATRRPRITARPDQAVRPHRAVARVFVATALLLAVPATWASAAHAAVWTVPAGARVFPSTPAGTRQSVSINAAGNEYEGFQIALRGGGGRHASAVWSTDSDALLTQNASLYQVGFVTIRRATTDSHAKTGPYPDPLIPRGFGQAITVPAGSSTVYVLVHVPYGTPPGTRTGTLHVTNGSETLDVPVALRVWDLGWQRLSTHTGFSVNVNAVHASIAGSGVKWNKASAQRILAAFYRMMQEHGVTPLMPNTLPPGVTADGRFDQNGFARDLSYYFVESGLDLPDVQIPWINWFPHTSWRRAIGSPQLHTYLTGVCQTYARYGWQRKAYAYIIDEPNSTAEERVAERYARALHAASAHAGFRCRFLLTDDPRPSAVSSSHAANRFLFDDVDIWASRYYYFFGRVPALRQQQARGKEIWWYPYANRVVSQIPNFVIEKSLADERVFGWQMHQWNVDGLLYWGFARWGDAVTGKGLRDTYRDPLSCVWRTGRVCNGEAMLVYPGYYPRYGLKNAYAPPVSSLRLEALRDGFEDREYLRLATAAGGHAYADGVCKTITWYPYPVRYGHVFQFPKYVKSASAFDGARVKLAQWIESQSGGAGADPAQ